MPDVATLVVDDEETLRRVISIVLEQAGHKVFTAGSGNEALAVLAREKVDLVISDIVMPETDGIELVREIRAKYPLMKIISMSGGGNYLTAALCLKLADQMGASGILSKPFTPAQLMESVEQALASPSKPHTTPGSH
ncbi:MAG TPA: response regulator [Opitutaceae bacterium]